MRILLKISWESLKWKKDFWIDSDAVKQICKSIIEIKELGHELAIVVWWWNIYRGSNLIESWLTSSDSHNLSMLSTVFNWVVLKDSLIKSWFETTVMSSLSIDFLENFNKDKAKEYLQNGKIVIFSAWTWNPYFTTDTGWVLKALEIEADFMIKATKVDWVYDKDPLTNKDAKLLEDVSYDYVINNNLWVMDITSVVMAKENSLIIKIVNFNKKWAIINAIDWKREWTVMEK